MLKIVNVAKDTDKTGVDFFKVGFEPMYAEDVWGNDTIRHRNFFNDRDYKDGVIKSDPIYAKLAAAGEKAIGQKVMADTKTLDTTPYDIKNANGTTYTAHTITVVVFSNENPITVANRQLKQYGANVIDKATGEVLGNNPIQAPIFSNGGDVRVEQEA